MSGTEETTGASSDASPTRGDVGDPVATMRVLAAESTTRAQRLRGAQIPQHIGMAAACRALAIELPRALSAQVDADLAGGVLAQRWEAVRAAAAEPGASGDFDSTLFALALLLREQSRAVMRHLVRREKDWTADAYRLEGQASALEGISAQLSHVAGDVSGSEAAAEVSQATAATERDGGATNARAAIER